MGILTDVPHAVSPSLIKGFGEVVGHGRDGTTVHAVYEVVDVPIACLTGYLVTLGQEAVRCVYVN